MYDWSYYILLLLSSKRWWCHCFHCYRCQEGVDLVKFYWPSRYSCAVTGWMPGASSSPQFGTALNPPAAQKLHVFSGPTITGLKEAAGNHQETWTCLQSLKAVSGNYAPSTHAVSS